MPKVNFVSLSYSMGDKWSGNIPKAKYFLPNSRALLWDLDGPYAVTFNKVFMYPRDPQGPSFDENQP